MAAIKSLPTATWHSTVTPAARPWECSVSRARLNLLPGLNLAAEYQAHTDEKVIPAFEIITTVASSAPGPDGDYSDEATVESLRPLIDEARKNGVYVILDFQPGRSTFTEQVKQYEELLKEPHVGLGIDPEWRLYPGQVHLQQIGTVDASEINETLDYLAALTDKHRLPQKMVVLHQFTHSMITNRAALDTSHPELALTLHAGSDLPVNTAGCAGFLGSVQVFCAQSPRNLHKLMLWLGRYLH